LTDAKRFLNVNISLWSTKIMATSDRSNYQKQPITIDLIGFSAYTSQELVAVRLGDLI
jgi:hypothetical protein